MTKFSDIHPGDILIADAGFCCLEPRQECEVKSRPWGNGFQLYITCNEGQHYLADYLNKDRELVNFTLKGPARKEQLWKLCEEFIKTQEITGPGEPANPYDNRFMLVENICKVVGYHNASK
jgi:hypothetical protein